jgi:UDP-N-acetylmuramoyl-tripeptide--D-alanyl-D-alanine ligase
VIWWLVAACALATIPAGLRWLRVAQREHYLPPAVATFAGRWWISGPANIGLLTLMVVGLVGSWWSIWWAFLVPVAQVGPVGLSVRGRTSSLAWTGRLRRAAVVSALLIGGIFALGASLESPFFVALGVFLIPAMIDLALLGLGPIERMMGNRWVDQAAARLKASGAKVVGITGSYDHHQAIRRPSPLRLLSGGGQPGVLQQPDGVGPGNQREPPPRHRGLRRRDGDLRAGRDRRDDSLDTA